jgi:hypothetical protein
MTSNQRYLLLGTRRNGITTMEPIVVEIDAATHRVVAHHPLSGHEPHSTTYLRAILDLDLNEIHEL